MTAMVAGWVIRIFIRCVIHIAGSALVIRCLVEMTVKRPYRPVSEGADDEPHHEKPFDHSEIVQQFDRVFQRFAPGYRETPFEQGNLVLELLANVCAIAY